MKNGAAAVRVPDKLRRSRPAEAGRKRLIRIFHLVDSFRLGGTESQAVQAIRRLRASAGTEVGVGCLQKHGPLLDVLDGAGISVKEFHVGGSFFRPGSAWKIAEFARFLRRERYDVLHTHCLYTNLFGIPAGKLARIPVISSRRELHRWWWDTSRRMRLLTWLQSKSAMVLANSDAIREQMIREESFDPSRIRVLHNAVEIERFGEDRTTARARLFPQASDGEPLVAMVANMNSEVKGHAFVIEAARSLRALIPGIRFVLVGDGKLRAELEASIANLGLQEHFVCLGARNDVPSILRACDAALLASTAEGLPNAVLEYMAACLPVVATSVGGVGELIEHGVSGLLIPPGDAGAIAEALVSVLQNEDLARRYGTAAQRTVEARFSFERLTADLLALYTQVAKNSQSKVNAKRPGAVLSSPSRQRGK